MSKESMRKSLPTQWFTCELLTITLRTLASPKRSFRSQKWTLRRATEMMVEGYRCRTATSSCSPRSTKTTKKLYLRIWRGVRIAWTMSYMTIQQANLWSQPIRSTQGGVITIWQIPVGQSRSRLLARQRMTESNSTPRFN